MSELASEPLSPSIEAVEHGISHRDSLELLRHQADILELQSSGARLPTVLTAVTTALEQLIPTSRCSILLFDGTTRTLTHGAAPSLPPTYSAAIDGMAIGEYAGSCGSAAYLAAPVVAVDIATDRRWHGFRDLALAHGLRSCWSSPILGGDHTVLGTFAVYYDEPHRPTRQETQLVARFRHLAAVAIEHALLFGALIDSEERFRRAFEDNAVGMALLDLHGRFHKVNTALCAMVNRDESSLLGLDVRAITHPDDVAAGSAALHRLTTGRTGNIQLEKRYLRPDGTSVAVMMTASVVRGEDGAPRHLCTNVLDVTERNAAEAERRARNAAEADRLAAVRTSQAKSQFLAAMSHELRTPLSAIVGFAELLQTLDLSAERRSAAARHITGAAHHILSFVDDVLDLATIEAGAIALAPATLPVAPLLREAAEVVELLAADRRVRLEVDVSDDVTVCADRRRLRQILLNLLSNAIKYNRRDGTVRLLARRHGDRTTIEVRDTGAGIPADRLARLFTPFDRLGADDTPGTGLGLAVSRQLAEVMGGELLVRGAHDGGTVAEVRLPSHG